MSALNLYDEIGNLLYELDRMRSFYESCGDTFKKERDQFDTYFMAAVYAANCAYLQVPTMPLFECPSCGSYGHIVCGKCLMPIYDRLFDESDFIKSGNPLEGLHGTEWCPHCGKKIDWSGVNFREYFD